MAAAAPVAASPQKQLPQAYTIITHTGKEPTGATVWVRLFGARDSSSGELQLGNKGDFRKNGAPFFTSF